MNDLEVTAAYQLILMLVRNLFSEILRNTVPVPVYNEVFRWILVVDSDRAQELKVAPVNHVSVTQQKTAPELERVVYPQPNISVYRPYERTTETGTDLQVLRTAAAEPPLVSKQQQPPPASHRQENVFIRPQSAGEQPPNNRKVVKRKTLRWSPTVICHVSRIEHLYIYLGL